MTEAYSCVTLCLFLYFLFNWQTRQGIGSWPSGISWPREERWNRTLVYVLCDLWYSQLVEQIDVDMTSCDADKKLYSDITDAELAASCNIVKGRGS